MDYKEEEKIKKREEIFEAIDEKDLTYTEAVERFGLEMVKELISKGYLHNRNGLLIIDELAQIFRSGPSETSKRIQRVNRFWRNVKV